MGCSFLREQSRKRLRTNYFEERQKTRAPAGAVRRGTPRPTPLFAPSPGTPLPDLHPPSHSDGDSGKFPFDRRPLVVFPAEIGFQRIPCTRGYGVGHPRAILKHPFPTPPHPTVSPPVLDRGERPARLSARAPEPQVQILPGPDQPKRGSLEAWRPPRGPLLRVTLGPFPVPGRAEH